MNGNYRGGSDPALPRHSARQIGVDWALEKAR